MFTLMMENMTTGNWYTNPSVSISVANSFQFLIPSLESCFNTIAKFPAAVPCAHTCKSDLIITDGWVVHQPTMDYEKTIIGLIHCIR